MKYRASKSHQMDENEDTNTMEDVSSKETGRKTQKDRSRPFQIPTIKIDFTPNNSSSSTINTWSSMSISLPPTESCDSQMNVLLSSSSSSAPGEMRLSISEPVLLEKEGRLVFQAQNKRYKEK